MSFDNQPLSMLSSTFLPDVFAEDARITSSRVCILHLVSISISTILAALRRLPLVTGDTSSSLPRF